MESKCLHPRQMIMSGIKIEQIMFGYIVPVFIAFGIVGNIINLTVLLTPPMRSRSFMLWFLALCDIFFLFFIAPHSMAQYDIFAFNNTFRWIYLNAKVHLITLTNWASAAAVWTVLFICFERLLAIRYPLKVHRYAIDRAVWRRTLILLITVKTGLLTAYLHFSYTKIAKTFCNGTQFHAYHVAVNSEKWPGNRTNPNPEWLQNYVYWSAKFHELFIIFMPTVIIIFANALLILTLRSRNEFIRSVSRKNDPTVVKTDQNITYTVCAIVTSFTITQAPSGFVSALIGLIPFSSSHRWHAKLLVATNTMVIIGKSLNFVLFCLNSATFRQRLVSMLRSKFPHRKKTKFSLLTQTTQIICRPDKLKRCPQWTSTRTLSTANRIGMPRERSKSDASKPLTRV